MSDAGSGKIEWKMNKWHLEVVSRQIAEVSFRPSDMSNKYARGFVSAAPAAVAAVAISLGRKPQESNRTN